MTKKGAVWTAAIIAAAGIAGYTLFTTGNPLRVQLLDVSGYTDRVPVWMTFRVNIGLTNGGRDLITIRRVHVEPDFDDFNEAYNVGVVELNPPLVVTPGSSLSYQAQATLLNATQLQPGTRALTLRVRIEQNGEEVLYEFPAQFDHDLDPARRALRF
jgi:hypothetical protein